MIKKAIYSLLFLAIVVLSFYIYREEHQKVTVSCEETSQEMETWNKIISTDVNKSKIKLMVDGTECAQDTGSIYMSSSRDIMIPKDSIRDAFDVSIHLYDQKRLVIQKGETQLSINVKSPMLDVNGKEVSLSDTPVWKDDVLYVPLKVFEEGLSYSNQWNFTTNQGEVSSDTEEKFVLPSSYSYEKQKRISKTKDQKEFGTCWAFASLTALETTLMPEEKLTFSAENMALQNSFVGDVNSGGDYTMSIAYLSAWQGPVLEKDDKYGDLKTPKDAKAAKHVQEVQIVEANDNEEIKKMIFQYGGVQSSLYTSLTGAGSSSEYYNEDKSAYCYIGSEKADHDVVIIGWDDNYPAENFTTNVPGDGAYICRNSWGSKFGDKGDFYVSYYDSNIGLHNIVYTGIEDTDNYDHIYQTDLCGWVGNLGFAESESIFFSNVYQTKGKEKLEAVSFYAPVKDSSYEVYLVPDFKNKDSLLTLGKCLAKGSFDNSGYYTVKLDKAVDLAKKEKYAVVVWINTPGCTKPIAIEYAADDQTQKVDIGDGEGYYSMKGTAWDRAEDTDLNICLKAFTSDQ